MKKIIIILGILVFLLFSILQIYLFLDPNINISQGLKIATTAFLIVVFLNIIIFFGRKHFGRKQKSSTKKSHESVPLSLTGSILFVLIAISLLIIIYKLFPNSEGLFSSAFSEGRLVVDSIILIIISTLGGISLWLKLR